jgi:hypothetical protein
VNDVNEVIDVFHIVFVMKVLYYNFYWITVIKIHDGNFQLIILLNHILLYIMEQFLIHCNGSNSFIM